MIYAQQLIRFAMFLWRSGIFLLTMANIFILSKFHNIFIFDQNNVIKNTLIPAKFSILIWINWIWGFGFLPCCLYFSIFMFRNLPAKALATLVIYLSFEGIFSYFGLGGAIGAAIFSRFAFAMPIAICSTIYATYLIFFHKPKPAKKTAKIKTAAKELLPSPELLTIGQKISVSYNPESQKKALLQTLKDFNISAKVVDIKIGPVVTLFSVELAAGTKSSRLVSLSDDIARNMQTHSTRIASIPGKNLVGIEIANEKRQTVYFKEALKQDYGDLKLPLFLGCNIYGNFETFDLSAMPHLLVAGTTGSGKSIGIHAMLMSLLFKKLPNELKLILIDPKKIELAQYDEIPHLLMPVIIDPKQAVLSLKWVVQEMEGRYARMSKLGVRNISTYNAKFEQNPDELLPYLVVVVDEMADLMLVAGKEIEICVQRLAQMGRAAGIHIIMATQRPSIDVITGTIKANFPTRISFKLSTKIDSRTILGDHSGAEQLLGAGDMLYLSIDGQLKRVHGCYVSEEDVNATVDFWKTQGKPQYIELSVEDEAMQQSGTFDDPYYNDAVALIKRTKKVSTSFLQRNFPIGYNRAAKMIEQMEKDGVISTGDKFGRNRDIL